jgi:hypothetical protein
VRFGTDSTISACLQFSRFQCRFLRFHCGEADCPPDRLLSSKYMPTRYAQYMYDWEHRLTSVDNNRVVRPLEWGVEYAQDWPCRNGWRPGQAIADPERFLREFNQRILTASDDFFSYAKPTDFRLERREVQVFSTREKPDLRLEVKGDSKSK